MEPRRLGVRRGVFQARPCGLFLAPSLSLVPLYPLALENAIDILTLELSNLLDPQIQIIVQIALFSAHP